MRKLRLVLGVGLLATSVMMGGIACSSDNKDNNASDTPTSVLFETSTPASAGPGTPGYTPMVETPPGPGTPGYTPMVETPTVEATTTPAGPP